MIAQLAPNVARADQTNLPSGHWFGQPIEAMARDIRDSLYIGAVVPVGQAWNRAFREGVAAAELGIAPAKAVELQKIAFKSLAKESPR